jgi:hypothetical protein
MESFTHVQCMSAENYAISLELLLYHPFVHLHI